MTKHNHKQNLLLCLLSGALSFNAFADTANCPSTINNVTVYPKGAMVERKAHVKLPKGVTEVKLSLLSPNWVQKLLQIGVTNADISIISPYS